MAHRAQNESELLIIIITPLLQAHSAFKHTNTVSNCMFRSRFWSCNKIRIFLKGYCRSLCYQMIYFLFEWSTMMTYVRCHTRWAPALFVIEWRISKKAAKSLGIRHFPNSSSRSLSNRVLPFLRKNLGLLNCKNIWSWKSNFNCIDEDFIQTGNSFSNTWHHSCQISSSKIQMKRSCIRPFMVTFLHGS